MKHVKVVNPASHLMLVNPSRKGRRKTNMARRKSTRRKTAHHGLSLMNPRRHNPRRRNPRRVTVINPRRRRNPEVKGLVKKSAIAAAGAMVTNGVLGFIPPQYQQGWTGIGVRLGVAYGVGWAAERFVSREVAEMLAVGGAAAAAGEAINMLLNKAGIALPSGPQRAVIVPQGAAAALPPGQAAAVPGQAAATAAPAMGDIVEVTGPFTEYGDQGFGDIIMY